MLRLSSRNLIPAQLGRTLVTVPHSVPSHPSKGTKSKSGHNQLNVTFPVPVTFLPLLVLTVTVILYVFPFSGRKSLFANVM